MTEREKLLLILLGQSLDSLRLIGRVDNIGADRARNWDKVGVLYIKEALAFDVKIARVHVEEIETKLQELFPLEINRFIKKN